LFQVRDFFLWLPFACHTLPVFLRLSASGTPICHPTSGLPFRLMTSGPSFHSPASG
jgi:hypothetical protein